MRRVVIFALSFVVGWVTVNLMTSGTTLAIYGLVGILAALVVGALFGYRLKEDLENEQ
jgi:hypothetical protein